MTINREVAMKVLETVDAGLVRGVGEPVPGQMCVEAAVCYAMGLPHGDNPSCVSRALRSLKITLNDSDWSSNDARAKGMRRLAIAQLGSRDVLDDVEFAKRVSEMTIRTVLPPVLRKIGLYSEADLCEQEGSHRAAHTAAADAAAYAADAAADAAAYAADAAAYAAAYAAYAAAYAVDDERMAAAGAAAYAAAYAARAARAAKDDKVLSDFAENVVQILIEMGAPGCTFLELTE